MDFQKTLSQSFEIVKLKEPAMQAVSKDVHALQPALILSVLGAVLGSLGSYFFPVNMMGFSYQPDLASTVYTMVTSSIITIAGLFLTGFLAERVFHSKLNMHGYVKVMGHANILSIAGIYPSLTIISSIWTFVVFCFLLSKVGKLGVGSIILLIILELVLFGVLGTLVGGMMGTGYGAYPSF